MTDKIYKIGVVYAIVNNTNGKMYVGSSVDFNKRYLRHLNALNSNKHHNINIQKDYNLGHTFSHIFLLELNDISRNELYKKEQTYLDEIDSTILYNIADSKFGDSISRHPNKDKILKNRSSTIISNNKKLSDDEIRKKYGKPKEKMVAS